MARRKLTTLNHEPCPACGKGRFKGSTLPICDDCVANHATPELLDVLCLFRHRCAPLDVRIPLNNALIEDCKESRRAAAKA